MEVMEFSPTMLKVRFSEEFHERVFRVCKPSLNNVYTLKVILEDEEESFLKDFFNNYSYMMTFEFFDMKKIYRLTITSAGHTNLVKEAWKLFTNLKDFSEETGKELIF